jgi:hypothetical protein
MNERDRAVDLILEAQKILWLEEEVKITTPGIIKELIVAKILGHKNIKTKHDADACSFVDENEKYEYLCCEEGGSFQMDRMYGHDKTPEQQEKSKHRIARNKYFYHIIFYKNKPLYVKEIYEIDVNIIWERAKSILHNTSNISNHIGFPIKWTKEVGELVYKDEVSNS